MNSNLNLPKLIKLEDYQKNKKPKILLLSDDLTLFSGIATMSREFVTGTAHIFDWVQLGSALQHPNHGKVMDLSDAINKERKISNASVKLYCHTGYGNPQVLRELIQIEKPDVILHFTDPRFWEWLYLMEYELRVKIGIPIAYYNIWDAPPAPLWNAPFYKSCDLIMNISKQTHQLVKTVLGELEYHDMEDKTGTGTRLVSYVPHGINQYKFCPIDDNPYLYEEYKKFEEKFYSDNKVQFVIFWNNRNIRRKQPGDVILAYKKFCDKLSKKDANKCCLFMHTQILDENGTDLFAVKENICPEYKVVFSDARIDDKTLNFFYNLADVTLNIASNEGFGLSGAESIMAGTCIINNVTGGLQDQCGFYQEKPNGKSYETIYDGHPSNSDGIYKSHGEWAFPIFPTSHSLQGSIATPYIFDERCEPEDVAIKLLECFNLGRNELKRRGLLGRYYAKHEGRLNSEYMCSRMAESLNKLMAEWKRPERIKLIDVNKVVKTKLNV